jgi:hypothetical protein
VDEGGEGGGEQSQTTPMREFEMNNVAFVHLPQMPEHSAI